MTKFAIVTATYRRPDGKTPFYLNRALDCVLKQTHTNYKVFLIGDRYDNQDEFASFGNGFTDENLYKENLTVAAERDIYTNKEILWKYGGCNASNHGIDVALSQGFEYICRLDHDDRWTPNHLKNFDELVKLHNPMWMCSRSTHIRGTLPTQRGDGKFAEFYPAPASLIKSSTCINQKVIPLRTRNIYQQTGKVGRSADSDLWERISKYMKENELKGYLVNEVTCYHDEEGYSIRNEI
jgi:glycosyltransferase involved in cell wall biosynthesis